MYGFPGSSVGKESTCNAGDSGSIPGSGRSAGEGIGCPLQYSWASLVTQPVKKPPAMWETWVRSLGWEDPLEKEKAIHSSILAWRIPWTKSMGSQRVWHDWATFTFIYTYTYIYIYYHFWFNRSPLGDLKESWLCDQKEFDTCRKDELPKAWRPPRQGPWALAGWAGWPQHEYMSTIWIFKIFKKGSRINRAKLFNLLHYNLFWVKPFWVSYLALNYVRMSLMPVFFHHFSSKDKDQITVFITNVCFFSSHPN